MNVRGQGKGKGMRLTYYYTNNNHRTEYRETRKQILGRAWSLKQHSHKGLPLSGARRCWACSSVTHTLCLAPSSLPVPAGLAPLAWASCCLCCLRDAQPLHRGVRCRRGVLVGRWVSEAGLSVMGLGSLLTRHPQGGLRPVIHALK